MLSFGLASGEWASISEETAAERDVTLVQPNRTPEELRSCTESALAAAAAGTLRPVIGQRFPLERAADAHERLEGGHVRGKLVLTVD